MMDIDTAAVAEFFRRHYEARFGSAPSGGFHVGVTVRANGDLEISMAAPLDPDECAEKP